MLLILSYPMPTPLLLTTADLTTGEEGKGAWCTSGHLQSRLPPSGCFGSQLWQKGTAHQTDKLKRAEILMSQS